MNSFVTNFIIILQPFYVKIVCNYVIEYFLNMTKIVIFFEHDFLVALTFAQII